MSTLLYFLVAYTGLRVNRFPRSAILTSSMGGTWLMRVLLEAGFSRATYVMPFDSLACSATLQLVGSVQQTSYALEIFVLLRTFDIPCT